MVGKTHGRGPFPKWGPRLGYRPILDPLFWECLYPRALLCTRNLERGNFEKNKLNFIQTHHFKNFSKFRNLTKVGNPLPNQIRIYPKWKKVHLYFEMSYIYKNWSSTSPTSLAHSQPTQFEITYPVWNGRRSHKCMTNKTKPTKRKHIKICGMFDQLSHNTYGNGDGATINKLSRRGETKLFKCVEPRINPLLLFG